MVIIMNLAQKPGGAKFHFLSNFIFYQDSTHISQTCFPYRTLLTFSSKYIMMIPTVNVLESDPPQPYQWST